VWRFFADEQATGTESASTGVLGMTRVGGALGRRGTTLPDRRWHNRPTWRPFLPNLCKLEGPSFRGRLWRRIADTAPSMRIHGRVWLVPGKILDCSR